MNSAEAMSPAAYIRAGFALVPIPLGSKGPRTMAWNQEGNAVRDEANAGRLVSCNYGLAHRWCGTCAVDIDDFQRASSWLASHGIDLQGLLDAEEAVQIVSGKANRAKLLYRLPHDISWLPTHVPEHSGLELRCANGDGSVTVQDVLPPSIHPETGIPYRWGGKGGWDNLPTLPNQLLMLWHSLTAEPRGARIKRDTSGDPILESGRNSHLASLAGAMRHRGVSHAVIEKALMADNAERCSPPLDAREVQGIAQSYARYAPSPESAAVSGKSQVILTRGSDVQPEAVDWLWDGWLASGKFHLIGGAPGTGKTTIAAGLAAIVTVGGAWPDGSQAEVGSVVFWSGEDDNADTLNPRLRSAGANMDRVFMIDGVHDGRERHPFDPAKDMDTLRMALESHPDIRLIVIDPIVSAVSGDSHKNAEVRRGLQPLVDLARELGCAVLGVTHFTKGTSGRDPVERITGSLAFAALARVVIVAAKRGAEGSAPDRRLMIRAKSNLGPDGDGFVYELMQGDLHGYPGVSASSAQWREPVHGSARDLLADAEQPASNRSPDAVSFLRDLLANGPMDAGEVTAAGKTAGFSIYTLKRAKARAGVVSTKQPSMQGGWEWKLTPAIQIDGLFDSAS